MLVLSKVPLVATVAFATLAGAANYKRVTCPDGNYTATNEACCVFYALRDDLQTNLYNHSCTRTVHGALRLVFHDAMGYSISGAYQGGGADGSIMLFADIETNYLDNIGMAPTVNALAPFLAKYGGAGLTAGDLIEFAAAVGISNCPGSPRLQFLAGRPNATIPASPGTVPGPTNNASSIFARFRDAGGMTPEDVVYLLASHSIANSNDVVPGHTGVPFDTTPFKFDTQYFLEVLLRGTGVPYGVNNTNGAEVDSPLPQLGELRIQSDYAVSRDNRTACTWQSLVDNQQLMMENFRKSMIKLANIGQNVSKLVDCSEVIPKPIRPETQGSTYPDNMTYADVEQVCPSPFPLMPTDPYGPTYIPACPDGSADPSDCPN